MDNVFTLTYDFEENGTQTITDMQAKTTNTYPYTTRMSGYFIVDYTTSQIVRDGSGIGNAVLSYSGDKYSINVSSQTSGQNVTTETFGYTGVTPTVFDNVSYQSTSRSFNDPVRTQASATNAPVTTTQGDVVCYAAGTMILTAFGNVPIEDLACGDMVVTISGERRPIRWIGRRSFGGRFASRNADVLPICFKAGCIADNVPERDLWVSPKHAMFLDDVLVPAAHLVNGVSIRRVNHVERIDYYHVELDTHDVLLAEGTPCESYVEDNNRSLFQNAHEWAIAKTENVPEAIYCAPRVESGFKLQEIRRCISARCSKEALVA